MGKQLDVLLVNPGGHDLIYQKDMVASNIPAKEPPVWAAMLATYVRRLGFSVEILDANVEDLGPQEAARRISEVRPRLAAFVIYGHQPSASTQTMVPASEAACALKELAPNQTVLFVGGHVAALPERTLAEEATDFVATGEGPVTLAELLAALRTGDRAQLHKVRGLGWRRDDEGGLIFNPSAPNVMDLTREMPGMAWDLLPVERYRAHDWHCYGRLDRRQPYAAFYTTLGCPYHCDFCCIQSPFKPGESALGMKPEVNSYRFWDPALVVGWVDALVQRGVSNIKIADEMFVLNPRHVMKICDLLIERGYGDHLNIWAYSRIDTCRPEFLDKLRRAGFRWLCFGIEAADAGVRSSVDKGSFGDEKILDVVGITREAGIYVLANFIFGLPLDTFKTMHHTLDLALEIGGEYTNFYSAMAYPGSALYYEALRRGWPLPETWMGFSQHGYDTLPLPTQTLSGGQVLAFRDWAYRTFYSHPPYLAMMEREFGSETAAHVRKFGAVSFERRHAAI